MSRSDVYYRIIAPLLLRCIICAFFGVLGVVRRCTESRSECPALSGVTL